MRPAIVLQASGPNALGIVRSLGRAGVPVIACDHDPDALGLVSRYARPQVTASPVDEPDRFVEDLQRLARGLPEPGVLFATHDDALAAIGPREDDLGPGLLRPWSPWPVLRTVLDKAGQHAAARRIGFPVPATLEATGPADADRALRELRLPVIVKPREDAAGFRRRFRRQVLEAPDADALREALGLAEAHRPQVSEVIPGGDDALWTLGSYRDREGRSLAAFTGRKLRQWPPRFGTARAAEARWDPDLAARCDALLDELGFHGISQVEVKRDARDGRDHLIEVNPRSWLWIGLATDCGVNIPLACYLDAIGRPRPVPPGHRGNRRWILALKHVPASAREVAGGRWSAGAFARSVRPPVRDGVLDVRDPRPALSQLGRLAGRLRRG